MLLALHNKPAPLCLLCCSLLHLNLSIFVLKLESKQAFYDIEAGNAFAVGFSFMQRCLNKPRDKPEMVLHNLHKLLGLLVFLDFWFIFCDNFVLHLYSSVTTTRRRSWDSAQQAGWKATPLTLLSLAISLLTLRTSSFTCRTSKLYLWARSRSSCVEILWLIGCRTWSSIRFVPIWILYFVTF